MRLLNMMKNVHSPLRHSTVRPLLPMIDPSPRRTRASIPDFLLVSSLAASILLLVPISCVHVPVNMLTKNLTYEAVFLSVTLRLLSTCNISSVPFPISA